MRKFVKTVYETIDGKCFENYNEAIKHEADVLETVHIQSLAIVLRKFCQLSDCDTCPFSKDDDSCALQLGSPASWKIDN